MHIFCLLLTWTFSEKLKMGAWEKSSTIMRECFTFCFPSPSPSDGVEDHYMIDLLLFAWSSANMILRYVSCDRAKISKSIFKDVVMNSIWSLARWAFDHSDQHRCNSTTEDKSSETTLIFSRVSWEFKSILNSYTWQLQDNMNFLNWIEFSLLNLICWGIVSIKGKEANL